MTPLVSPLASHIERFLQFKRALGCRYRDEERQLGVLDRFLATRLTPEDAVMTEPIIRAYVTRGESKGAHRLTVIRELCRFLAAEEPRTVIVPSHFLGIGRRPFLPRILTVEEGRAFLSACLHLAPGRCSPLSGMVHGTALALLYLTGMRVGEALSLNLDDVDLSRGIIRIRHGKFGKSRFVPLAEDLTDRLGECRHFVEQTLPLRTSSACFFPGPKGSRCTTSALRASFRKILAAAGIPYLGTGKGPRLHDLRHTWAVHRMRLWYEQGVDLGVYLPLLATYLGHVSLSSSQYYLRLTEDLLRGVLGRYEERFGALIEERRKQ